MPRRVVRPSAKRSEFYHSTAVDPPNNTTSEAAPTPVIAESVRKADHNSSSPLAGVAVGLLPPPPHPTSEWWEPARLPPASYHSDATGEGGGAYPGLIQLRPGPRFATASSALTAAHLRPPPPPSAPRGSSGRAPLSRWIFVYIPAVLFVGLVLYVVCELAMKHFAFANLQEQLRSLPEMPLSLPSVHAGGMRSPHPAQAPAAAPTTTPAPVAAAANITSSPASDVSFALRSVVMRPHAAWPTAARPPSV